MLTETRPSQKRDGNSHVLADSHWEMLLKTVGQPLGTAKEYGKATGKWTNTC
jgi:hypothetical protein